MSAPPQTLQKVFHLKKVLATIATCKKKLSPLMYPPYPQISRLGCAVHSMSGESGIRSRGRNGLVIPYFLRVTGCLRFSLGSRPRVTLARSCTSPTFHLCKNLLLPVALGPGWPHDARILRKAVASFTHDIPLREKRRGRERGRGVN